MNYEWFYIVARLGFWGFSRLFCRMDAAYHQTPPTPS
jgi:hypothetical protein